MLLAGVFENGFDLALDLLVCGVAHSDAAGGRALLNARRDVHPVAVDVVALDDHVSEVDADAEHDPPAIGHVGVALGHAALDGNRAFHSVDDARELDQGAVAHQLDDAPPIRSDGRVDERGAMRLEPGQRTRFVGAHQPAIADDIRAQDGGKPAYDALPCHDCFTACACVPSGVYGWRPTKSNGADRAFSAHRQLMNHRRHRDTLVAGERDRSGVAALKAFRTGRCGPRSEDPSPLEQDEPRRCSRGWMRARRSMG